MSELGPETLEQLGRNHAALADELRSLHATMRALHAPAPRTLRTISAAITSGTSIEIDFDPVRSGFVWLIERLGYYCSAANTVATAYMDAVDTGQILDYASSGSTAVNDQKSPIYLPEGSRLVVNWTSVTAPATARLHIQYQLLPLFPGV